METLPEGFILSGIETIIAMIMYPTIFYFHCDDPNLDLAAFSLQPAGYHLCLVPDDDNRLLFGNNHDLGWAFFQYSAGLSFLG